MYDTKHSEKARLKIYIFGLDPVDGDDNYSGPLILEKMVSYDPYIEKWYILTRIMGLSLADVGGKARSQLT